MSTYSAGEFARRMGVSVKTVQRWDRDGLLVPLRTLTNRRLYTDEHLAMARGFVDSRISPETTALIEQLAEALGVTGERVVEIAVNDLAKKHKVRL